MRRKFESVIVVPAVAECYLDSSQTTGKRVKPERVISSSLTCED